MQCVVYKFAKKPGWYAYLTCQKNDDNALPDDALARLPFALQDGLGQGTLLMHLNLDTCGHLAQVSIDQVKEKLAAQGYFIQGPPA